MKKTKQKTCKYSFPSFSSFPDYLCIKDGWNEVNTVKEEECELCENYICKYIEYPITVNSINNEKIDYKNTKDTCLCEVRLCEEEYKNKSFIGIYLGDLPYAIHTSYNSGTKELNNAIIHNSGIYIPELKRIVFGCESWWREIESIDGFKGINQEDIDNAWYVKLLKSLK